MAPDPRGATAEADDLSVSSSATARTEPSATVAPTEAPASSNGRPWGGVDTPGPAPARGFIARQPDPPMRQVRRGRRVKRVIRRIELWSVLKVSLILYTCAYAATMAALVVLWGFAYSAGLVDNFESFANDVGFENWQFYGEHMFREAAVIGGVLVVAGTVLTVLATALVNVISELTGGIRVVVIEEDTVLVPISDAD